MRVAVLTIVALLLAFCAFDDITTGNESSFITEAFDSFAALTDSLARFRCSHSREAFGVVCWPLTDSGRTDTPPAESVKARKRKKGSRSMRLPSNVTVGCGPNGPLCG